MKTQKWVLKVELEISENWIEDGFNPSAETFEDLIRDGILGYAYDHEKKVKVEIKKSPNPKTVRELQGYAN
ncbi:hypothetical protein EHQ53_14220 [Leptospira langatensis]|uniref:Uncharacterized protein n=1 Tax=Leptospira langatensis TaxID=2484983 RepID=A0ABY2M9Q7_9LEPT|nr:hypothetical protein [Leptospira langatensis]TGL39673.1 hypothetical protein EHQ53_14220 [Leptospira langatensis]